MQNWQSFFVYLLFMGGPRLMVVDNNNSNEFRFLEDQFSIHASIFKIQELIDWCNQQRKTWCQRYSHFIFHEDNYMKWNKLKFKLSHIFHFFSNNLNKFNFQFFKILMKNLQQFLSTELWRQSSVIFSTNVFLKIYLSRSIQVYTYTYLYIYISLPCPGQLCSSSLYFLFYFVFLFSFFSSLSGAALLILPLGRVEGEGT